MSTNSEMSKISLPVAITGGFCAAYGLTKGGFALHLLTSATLLGTAVGPYPTIVLSLVDTVVGSAVLVAGVFFIWRKQWALELIRLGWLPLIAYEVGRALGMDGAHPAEVDAYGVAMKSILLLLLLGVWRCIRSPSLDLYLTGQRH